MKHVLYLEDDQYEKTFINHTRKVARAIVLNEENKVALMYLNRNDEFGQYRYYETPGGGVNEDEDLKEAVVREIIEELGYKCDVVDELGMVDDYYNLIHRHNLNYYFLLKIKDNIGKNLEEYEKDLFEDVLWVDIDEAINKLEQMGETMIPLLVKRRELPIFKIAKSIIRGED